MKTKTLLMVAGAGALVYWLWKNNKAENADPYVQELQLKAKCERREGTWIPTMCEIPPCGGHCLAKDSSIINLQ